MSNRTFIMLCWLAGTRLLTWTMFAWLIPRLLGAVSVGYSLWAAVAVVIVCGLAAALIVTVLLRLRRM